MEVLNCCLEAVIVLMRPIVPMRANKLKLNPDKMVVLLMGGSSIQGGVFNLLWKGLCT